jgi:hypothetical protein
VIAVRLTGTTTVLNLLTAARDLLTGSENSLPAILTLGAPQTLGCLLINEKLATLDTDTTQDF